MSLQQDMRPDLAEVDRIVPAMLAALSDALSEDRLSTVEICLAEALTNAVNHARASQTQTAIHITAQILADSVRIEIIDAGRQSPSDLYTDVTDLGDIDPMDENGRGIPLISQLADEVQFTPAEGRNRLCLSFNRGNDA